MVKQMILNYNLKSPNIQKYLSILLNLLFSKYLSSKNCKIRWYEPFFYEILMYVYIFVDDSSSSCVTSIFCWGEKIKIILFLSRKKYFVKSFWLLDLANKYVAERITPRTWNISVPYIFSTFLLYSSFDITLTDFCLKLVCCLRTEKRVDNCQSLDMYTKPLLHYLHIKYKKSIHSKKNIGKYWSIRRVKIL